jgi:hypothetical protein
LALSILRQIAELQRSARGSSMVNSYSRYEFSNDLILASTLLFTYDPLGQLSPLKSRQELLPPVSRLPSVRVAAGETTGKYLLCFENAHKPERQLLISAVPLSPRSSG